MKFPIPPSPPPTLEEQAKWLANALATSISYEECYEIALEYMQMREELKKAKKQ